MGRDAALPGSIQLQDSVACQLPPTPARLLAQAPLGGPTERTTEALQCWCLQSLATALARQSRMDLCWRLALGCQSGNEVQLGRREVWCHCEEQTHTETETQEAMCRLELCALYLNSSA